MGAPAGAGDLFVCAKAAALGQVLQHLGAFPEQVCSDLEAWLWQGQAVRAQGEQELGSKGQLMVSADAARPSLLLLTMPGSHGSIS